jgi:hypothetical protein
MIADICIVILVLVIVFFLPRMLESEARPFKPKRFSYKGQGGYRVDAIGLNQDYLRALAGGRPGYVELDCDAELYCEDDNTGDPTEVKILIQGRTVGYLSREMAVQHRETIRTAGLARATATCRAKVRGGSADKLSYGVRLDI